MKKKLFSLALALALCWGLAVPVFASNLKESYETFHIMVPYYTVKKGTTDFAGVAYSSYWGLKDKSGNTVIEPVYADLTLVDNALIATKKLAVIMPMESLIFMKMFCCHSNTAGFVRYGEQNILK